MSIKSIAILLAMILLCIPKTKGQIADHKIEGLTWLDKDDDGIRSSTDVNLPNVKVDLFNELGIMIQFTLSDSDGNYSFTNLPNGSYYLKFETKQGLMFALKDVGDDDFDSDIPSNGFSSQFSLNSSTTLRKLDAGFRSSILIQTKAFEHVCEEDSVVISPIISGNNGLPEFNWSHDGSSENSISIIADTNRLLTVTVMDDWQIPVSKNIFIKVNKGVGSKDCADVDLFDSSEVPIDLFVSENNPGPISTTDINEAFLGGARTIEIELLEGTNISSINSSSGGLFINNCSGCRTRTTLTYFNPNNDYLDISDYDYFELTEMNIDQGNVAVSIEVSDDSNTAILSNIIESEGPNTNILPIFFFDDFEGYDEMNFSKLKSISLSFISVNESIDILMSSILSCSDDACNTTLLESNDICLSDSVTLSPITDCTDALIYFWDELGFGQEKIVSPIDTTTYNLTVYDQNGCSASFSSSVNVSQPPMITLEGAQNACIGQVINIQVHVLSGNPPYSYMWNGTPLDTSTIQFLAVRDTTIGVIVTDVNGCISTEQMSIAVHQNPNISLVSTDTDCNIPSGLINSQISSGTSPYYFEWSNGTINQEAIGDLDYGWYSLTVTDSLGCNAIDSALINFLPCAEIGNYTWHDVNFNGIQDTFDLPLQNVVVILRNALNQEIRRDTTKEDGLYLFTDLDTGGYFVEFLPPSEFYPTLPFASSNIEIDSDTDTSTFKTHKITLSQFEKNLSIDAGWYKKVCIGDQVWNDINLNSYFDSLDVGIENVLVKLLDCDQNLLDSTLTDTLGNYSFCQLNPGEYALQFCNPEGLVPVEQGIGDESVDSDISFENSSTDCKTTSSGDTLRNCDEGFYNISSIGDFVWHDINANGIQESEEPPLSNVTLHLYSCDDRLISSTTTDTSGYYVFDSLPGGEYFLEIVPLQNSILTLDKAGIHDSTDSDFSAITHRTSCISLPPGTDLRDIDAGLYYHASLGDYVWVDYDLNGLQDTEEFPVKDLTIYLYSCDNSLIDSTTSNNQGYYNFNDLTPGQYKISIAMSEDQAVTSITYSDLKLNNDVDNLTLASKCITLSSQQEYRDLDIGIYNLAKIGNFVWYDDNGNALQDTFEVGVPNIHITLLDCDENTIATTESDVDGYYCFDDIPYGSYSIHFDIPKPYSLVAANQGADRTSDSDPNPNSNTIDCITISEPIDTTLDAGISTCSTIGGTAWFDAYELNNIKDPLENGINGIKVEAYKIVNDTWQLEQIAYTGLKPGYYSDDGYWEMCVSPGEYFIQFSDITVVEAVVPNQGVDDFLDSDADHTFDINSTNIINVVPGVNDLSIGIGYKWKNSFKISKSYDKIVNSRIVVNEDQSTISFHPKSIDHSAIKNRNQLEKPIDSENVKLFPNPSLDEIHVEILNQDAAPLELIIYENTGKILNPKYIKSKEYNATWTVKLEGLTSGLHHLAIIQKDKVEWLPFIKI